MDDNDELETHPGVSITEVLSTGTARNGMAYLECRFAQEPEPALILFPKELAQTVCQGFLEAASLLDTGHPLRGMTVAPIPLRDATIHIAQDTIMTGQMVLVLTTESGARLAFRLPERSLEQMGRGVREVLRLLDRLPRPN